jgi:predicted ATPase
MKLDRVRVHNFRSIQNITVHFNPACRVLVGINESGKSNILNALSFLQESRNPVKKDDLREALPEEDPITQAYIRFIFKFEKIESDQFLKEVSTLILANTSNPKITSSKSNEQTLKEYCASKNEGLYIVNIIKESKSFTHWTTSEQLVDGWVKPTAACPADFTITVKGKDYQLSQYKLIRTADFKDIPKEYLEAANIDDLIEISGNSITTIVKENLPDTLFWEYDENNLLPSSINIDEFSKNPDVCTPLKNMFNLAGIFEIGTSIADAKSRGNNQFRNYLDGIAKKTTIHFRNVWKEYKNVEFSLQLNANNIEPGIKEKNILDFAKRSDGFKRFVTFLLMISVNVKTDNLTNTLLLIDEPEISLHPSGARYLREELIKISKTNYVIYSTHSIFMIDSSNISRHFIVKKNHEITDIEQAKDSNIADEEVIYNALGHSVFTVLKEKNIIFEGWKDKCLFICALDSSTASLKKKFEKIGFCHAKGVGTIKAITPMIELADRKCLIISDSDKPANDQKKIYLKEKGYGEWNNYQNIDPSIVAITGEDFVKNDYIKKVITSHLRGTSLPIFDTDILSTSKKLNAIHQWLTKNGMATEEAKETLRKIKDDIFENLKPINIESDYHKMLSGILSKFT